MVETGSKGDVFSDDIVQRDRGTETGSRSLAASSRHVGPFGLYQVAVPTVTITLRLVESGRRW